MGRFDVDTTDDGNVWVVLRRVNFYTGDLILSETEPLGVGVGERRLLDALDYAQTSGRPRVSTSTLCAIVQAPIRHSTAQSILQRMQDRSWLTSSVDGSKRQRWSLADKGHQIRDLYGQIAEQVLQRLYTNADDRLRGHLFDFGERAIEFMNDRLLPILDGVDEDEVEPLHTDHWRALRRVHFYLSDLIVRETAPMGVGMNERRVLDTFGYARKQGVDGGLAVSTICRLNPVLTRQIVLSVLERAVSRGWVTQSRPAVRSPLWDLTGKGVKAREIYKRYAQLKLCEVYGLHHDDEDGQRFLSLAQAGQAFRDARLEPVIEELRHARAAA